MRKIFTIIYIITSLYCYSYGIAENNLYEGSYALVIGVSDYTNGWIALPGVKKDIELVSSELEKKGFVVEKIINPTSQDLEKKINEFINNYGHVINNRLLFYFAGHGHTLMTSYGEDMGYIVPVDAPNPLKDKNGFLFKAMSMERFELFAKQIESKHALFMFDACFAGSIFSITRGDIPTNIEYKLSQPVRQFITSGSANETVPDISVFRQQFIDGLEGEADINHDGYITSSEMGEFLQEKVINYSKGRQHPQFGKIRNPRLDKGDLILISSKVSTTEKNLDLNSDKRNLNETIPENKDLVVFPLNFLNNEYLNYAPVSSEDGKTILFVSNRPGSKLNNRGLSSHDIWAVKKANRLDTIFYSPWNVLGINSEEDEGPGCFSPSGDEFYFSSLSTRPDGLGDVDIYKIEYSTEFNKGKPINLGPVVNSKYWDSNPSISPDQKRLYFASNRPGPNGTNNCDIWYSDWSDDDGWWMPPKNLSEINTQGKEFAPFISADGLTLFFSSDGLKPNYGGLDFYVTKYDTVTKKWSKPKNLGSPFNTPDDEMFINIPPTGDVVYISSKRTDVQGIQSRLNIYMIYLKNLKYNIFNLQN